MLTSAETIPVTRSGERPPDLTWQDIGASWRADQDADGQIRAVVTHRAGFDRLGTVDALLVVAYREALAASLALLRTESLALKAARERISKLCEELRALRRRAAEGRAA